MANKQTTTLRKRGQSLKFHKGVDFSPKNRTTRDPNPEFELVDMVAQKTGKGNPVNSTRLRENSGRRAYDAPTQREHPISGNNTKDFNRLAVLA